MAYVSGNPPQKGGGIQLVYFDRYEDFCYGFAGQFRVHVQEIGKGETIIMLGGEVRVRVIAIVQQPAPEMFAHIEPEELVRAVVRNWMALMLMDGVYRCSSIAELLEYLNE